MSYPTASPPTYGAVPSKQRPVSPEHEPLLLSSSAGPSGAGGIYNQPDSDDLPDDFKYGVTVSESSAEVRHAFIRKVYTILTCQILGTTIVGGLLSQSSEAILWVQANIWAFYVPLFGALINLGFLYWKRHSHPLNLVLLSTFTLLEASTLGVVVAFFDQRVVLQALFITLGVFIGLTAFTWQSKYDFSGMGPWLFGGLLVLLMTGLVGMFFPFSRTFDLIYAAGGCLIFSGYIIFDTFLITKKLSPDEYILGAVSLYLDFINLFLSVLRVLNDLQDR